MKRKNTTWIHILLTFLVMVFTCTFLTRVAQAKTEGLAFSSETCVFSCSTDKFIRKASDFSSLDECGEDEFITLLINVKNLGKSDISLSKPCISIDGGKKLYWADTTIKAGTTGYFHVFYSNVKYLTPGLHTAIFYESDKEVYSCRFNIGRKWTADFSIPDKTKLSAASTKERSPYLYSWLSIDKDTRYDAYIVDVKADYLPYGTYCCPANFYMDLSSLKKQYKEVSLDSHISGYAGLQRLDKGEGYCSIMSFWDIECTDAAGKTTTIRAERTYPAEKTSNDTFSGEGTGVHTIRPYDWQAGRWYRMLLICGTSEETGNTTVEQWILDLTTNEWTHACTYDTGVEDSCFVGTSAFFLENFLPKYAGEVRSMEVANVRIHTKSDGQWHDITTTGSIDKSSGSGSWQAGADKNAFYMITTGVTGQGRKEGTEKLTIQNIESGDPSKNIADLKER